MLSKVYFLKWKRTPVYLRMVSYLPTLKTKWNLGRYILYYSRVEVPGFRDSFSLNVIEIYSICIRRQDVRFSRIPRQLVPGPSSSRSYLCIKIRETPLLCRLRPTLKKFHGWLCSLETSGRRPETDGEEADGLVPDILRAAEMLVIKWPWSPCEFEALLYVCIYTVCKASGGIAFSPVYECKEDSVLQPKQFPTCRGHTPVMRMRGGTELVK